MSVDTVTAATPGQTEPDQTLPGEGADAAGREEFPGFGGIALPAGFELIAQDEALGPDVLQGLADVEARLGEALRYTDALADTAARHLLEAGGKRVRPLLTLLAARAAGAAEITGDVLDAAVVTELTHLATLYHDDVMDEAATRRGTDAARGPIPQLLPPPERAPGSAAFAVCALISGFLLRYVAEVDLIWIITAVTVLGALVARFGVQLVAIGNGTASRETDALAAQLGPQGRAIGQVGGQQRHRHRPADRLLRIERLAHAGHQADDQRRGQHRHR